MGINKCSLFVRLHSARWKSYSRSFLLLCCLLIGPTIERFIDLKSSAASNNCLEVWYSIIIYYITSSADYIRRRPSRLVIKKDSYTRRRVDNNRQVLRSRPTRLRSVYHHIIISACFNNYYCTHPSTKNINNFINNNNNIKI